VPLLADICLPTIIQEHKTKKMCIKRHKINVIETCKEILIVRLKCLRITQDVSVIFVNELLEQFDVSIIENEIFVSTYRTRISSGNLATSLINYLTLLKAIYIVS